MLKEQISQVQEKAIGLLKNATSSAELEEIKGIHIKKFLMEKEKLGRKPSYINDLIYIITVKCST